MGSFRFHRSSWDRLLVLFLVIAASPALASPLLSVQRDRLSLSLGEQRDGSQVLLTVTARIEGASQVSVFTLPTPPRAVFDVAGARVRRNYAFAVDGSRFVKAVRVGAHPDKTRLVIDLLSDTLPRCDGTVRGQAFEGICRFDLGRLPDELEQVIGQPSPTPSAPLSATATAFPPVTPSVPSAFPAEASRLDAPKVAAARRGEAPKTAPAGSLLSEIRFDYDPADRQPVTRLVLSHRPNFQIVRTQPGQYFLTLRKTQLTGEHLQLPFFPPQEFEGLLALQARSEGLDAVVALTTEPGAQLRYFANGDEIWLKVEAGQ